VASTLLVGAILTTGRHTVANLLRTLRHLASGHPTDYRRVLSRAPWSGLQLGCALVRFLLDHVVPDGPVALVGDDTADGHPGKSVYGKARHRDAVRSSHSSTAWRYGHKWVVLAVLVKFPFATRRWALPVLIDLYRTPELDRVENRPHKTRAQLMCRLLRVLLIRFPKRTFVFTGDSGFGTHEVARFCHRHGSRLTLVSKLHPDANLFEPPPPYAGNGRPRGKGARAPKPRQAAVTAPRTRLTVVWYGAAPGASRRPTARAHPQRHGQGTHLVPPFRRAGACRRRDLGHQRGSSSMGEAGTDHRLGRVAHATPDGRCVPGRMGAVAGRVNLTNHTAAATASVAGAVGAGQPGRSQDAGIRIVVVRPWGDALVHASEWIVAEHGRKYSTGAEAEGRWRGASGQPR
jgi:hypothetical protein